MDKQTTFAFVLIGLILIVWLYINAPEAPQQPPQTAQDTTQVEPEQKAKEPTTQEKDITEKPEEKTKEKDLQSLVSKKDTVEENIITVDTDLAKIELTSKGARIRKYYLKDYDTWYADKLPDTASFYQKHVQLINYTKDGGDLNLIFVTQEGKLINTGDVGFDLNRDGWQFDVSGDDSLKLVYTFNIGDNKKVKKTYTFFGNQYSSDLDIEMQNMDEVISSYRYDVAWEHGINFLERNSVDEAHYSNATAYAGGEEIIVDASSEGETVKEELNGKIEWVGVKNKYFSIIVAPKNPDSEGGAILEGTNKQIKGLGTREYYSTSLKIPFKNRDYQKDSFELYMGPIDYDLLSSYNNNYEAIYDFGSFLGLSFIIQPISEYILLPLFVFLHNFIPNYGFVIIVFTLIIKIALYPLTKKSFQSMKKMQQLQPKITEIKEKYKGDNQKIQKETMKMYKTYGVNPAGGCLPMLLQLPILVALYSLFKVAIELRNEPFILWIDNLAEPDVLLSLPFKLPILGIQEISGLALLLGITMFFQQKMTVKDPSQKALVYVMPVMLTLLFMTFPSGLNLYYFLFNLFSVAQQQYINHKKGEAELQPVQNPKKKGGFMQKMMDAAEKQAQQQKQAQRQPKKKPKKF
jgi:YidC/Oxa1 family membrane protein insertase